MSTKRKEWSILNRIANYLKKHPGLTGAEISQRIALPTAYRRLSELQRLGLARKGARMLCSVSQRKAYIWFPDNRDPEPDRGLNQTQEIKRLRLRVEQLEKQLAILSR